MIRTKSSTVGFLIGLEELENQFVNPIILAKLETMRNQLGYVGYRRCRGDGNCYYRALGFAYLESLLILSNFNSAYDLSKRFCSILDSAVEHTQQLVMCEGLEIDETEIVQACDTMRKFIDSVRSTRSNQTATLAALEFYTRVLGDPESCLDSALVRLMRLFSVIYCWQNKQTNIGMDGSSLVSFIYLLHGDKFEAPEDSEFTHTEETCYRRFLQEYVVRNGVEGPLEGLESALPLFLNFSLRVLQLDRNSFSRDSDFTTNVRPFIMDLGPDRISAGKPIQGPGGPDITVLFKPGHYDILYGEHAGNKVKSFQEASNQHVIKKCRVALTCTVCMEEESSPSEDPDTDRTEESHHSNTVTIHLLWQCGEHGLCDECLDCGSEYEKCPVCGAHKK